MVDNLNSYLTPNFLPKRKRYPSFSNIAENIFEGRLGIRIAPPAFRVMEIAATCFLIIGLAGIFLFDTGSWQQLASAVTINFSVTLFVLAVVGLSGGSRFVLNPLTGMLIMYALRRLISLFLVFSERSELTPDFLLVFSHFEYCATSSKAELVCAIGTIAFWLGWRQFRRGSYHSPFFWEFPRLSDRHLWGIYAIGVTLFYLEIVYSNELESLGALVTMTKVLPLGAIFALLTFSTRFGIGSSRLWVVLIAILPLTADVLTRGMKSAFLEVFLPVILAYLIRKPRIGILLTLFGTIFFLVFVFPYTQEYRVRVWHQGEEADALSIVRDVIKDIETYGMGSQIKMSAESFLHRFGGIGTPGVVVHAADRYGYLGPEFLQNLPYAFIPRAIWPSKPVFEPAAWFSWYLGWAPSPEEARTATALHIGPELYWMFGWVGVAVGMFLLGLMYRSIHKFLLARSFRSSAMVAVWYSFLVSVIFIEESRYNSALISPFIIVINGYVITWFISKVWPIKRQVQFFPSGYGDGVREHHVSKQSGIHE
jgi:hypothetical protein